MRHAWVSLALAGILFASSAIAQTKQTYVYDVQGRVTAVTGVVGTSTANVSGYAYDNADNRTVRRNDSFNQPANPDRLAAGEQIVLQQGLHSTDNRVHLYLQGDGHLVLYCNSTFIWSNGLYGNQAAFMAMQTDGNLVIYSGSGGFIWATGTNGHPGARMVVQNDGNLVIYDAGWSALWASGTGGTC